MTNNNENYGDPNRLITLAIHTYEHAAELKQRLAEAGIKSVLHNVDLKGDTVSSGVRVRIRERDLPQALGVVEQGYIHQPRFGSVLIPVDFSDYSLKACKVGFDYAQKINGSVILLHAYMNDRHRFFLPFPQSGDNADERQMRIKARQRMARFVADVRSRMADGRLPRVNIISQVSEGIPEERILSCADENDVVLIVMGTRGTSQKEYEMLGSVTAEVLDACRYPIFTVPEGIELSHIAAIRNVAFFSNLIQQDVMSFDIFSRLFGSGMQVSIIPVVEKKDVAIGQKSLKQLIEYCSEHYSGSTFTTKILPQEHFVEKFQQFVAEAKIDLIVVPNKKKSIFSRLFNPSIAHRVLFQSDTPMLVVPV